MKSNPTRGRPSHARASTFLNGSTHRLNPSLTGRHPRTEKDPQVTSRRKDRDRTPSRPSSANTPLRGEDVELSPDQRIDNGELDNESVESKRKQGPRHKATLSNSRWQSRRTRLR